MTLYKPEATNLNGVIQTWNSEGVVLQKMSVSSSPIVTTCEPEQVQNIENTYFHPIYYIPDPYIQFFLLFDCKEIRRHSIKARHYNNQHMNSWNFSRSNDEVSRYLLDWRQNTDLYGLSIIKIKNI